MDHQVHDQQRAPSTSSSLSYLSAAQTSPPAVRGEWKPRRRHAPPPTLPTYRRARGYDDLFPFQVSQLASVLCHAPPVNTPRDGAVWTAYVCHTNERIALLGHKLRAATTLPSFLPWSTNHGLCSIHRRLNAKPLEDLFAALRYEVEVRTREIWQPVALAGALSASQTEQLTLMEELRSLWLSPSEFMKKFNRLPAPKYAHQADGCVACMLARMGANVETAMALGAMLLGSMRRSNMLSTRVCFCREWVRYTVEGDVDCVDTALAEMEMMGTKFREARKWARQRMEGTGEGHERGLGLGGMPFVQPTRISSRQGLPGTGYQAITQTDAVLETSERLPDEQMPDGKHDNQKVTTASQQSPSLNRLASISSERCYPAAADLLPNHHLTSGQSSLEQYHSAHNSPGAGRFVHGFSVTGACSPEATLPSQRSHQMPDPQESWEGKNMLLNPSAMSEIDQKETITRTSSEAVPLTKLDTLPQDSPTSLYSEFTTNPFLDGSSSPSPIPDRNLPPDLPFRLFERRHAYGSDGSPSPPKNAVQWPNQAPLTKKFTAEQFKDGLVQVPCLARIEKGDRSVGALWKRRAEKTTAGGKRIG
ncbi:hypothetical protein E4T44_09953 [Aureobasidium sp. EXF-8845]|nr:hypothetical protein E4T44_09953 [Aureobasidium sp. EXF-8845]KAI4837007.1 hypothetical protein E4T45_09822 [Aureobasidium sp. EXF-8846]